MHNIETEEEFLELVKEKLLNLDQARVDYKNDPTEENKENLGIIELEYVDFRNYWRRIGEALGLRFGVSVRDMED